MTGITLGQQIARYRMAAGLNAADLAARVGMSRGYLSMIERDQTNTPSARMLAKIATALGVSVPDLLDTQPPPVRCKHWAVQWVTHPGGEIECMSCGKTWEVQNV